MSTVVAPDPPRTAPRPTPSRAAPPRTSQLVVDVDLSHRVSVAHDHAVRRWLHASMVAVLLALVVGGITRLTESGLSITSWKPITGIIPPLGDAEWERAYQAYLAIPEAQTVHDGITRDGFRALYWWEWFHRILARLVGVVIAIPFFWLLSRDAIRPSLRLRLANLPILVTLQGAMGWYMVQSGLTERTSVSPYRLVAHLSLAMVIYVLAAWTALRLRPGEPEGEESPRPDPGAVILACVVALVIATGGFVAGLDGGMVYNTFPLMGGQVVPAGYLQLEPTWRNWFENPAAAQFNHRFLALATSCAALLLAASRRRSLRSPGARRAWGLVALAVALQVTLGVATLLLHVAIPVATLHQAGAFVLLTAALHAAAIGRDDKHADTHAAQEAA